MITKQPIISHSDFNYTITMVTQRMKKSLFDPVLYQDLCKFNGKKLVELIFNINFTN